MNIAKRILLLFMLCFVPITCDAICFAQDIRLEDVLEGIRLSPRGMITSGEITAFQDHHTYTIKIIDTITNKLKRSEPSHGRSKVTCIFDGPKTLIEHNRIDEAGNKIAYDKWVYDGSNLITFGEDSPIKRVAEIMPEKSFTNRFKSYGFVFIDTLEKHLKRYPDGLKVANVINENNTMLVVLEGTNIIQRFRLYLEPQKGYICHKSEFMSLKTGEIVVIDTADNFVEVAKDIWYPKIFVHKKYFWDENTPKTLDDHLEVRIETVKFNIPISPEVFKTGDFPPDTQISDENFSPELRYIVPGGVLNEDGSQTFP